MKTDRNLQNATTHDNLPTNTARPTYSRYVHNGADEAGPGVFFTPVF